LAVTDSTPVTTKDNRSSSSPGPKTSRRDDSIEGKEMKLLMEFDWDDEVVPRQKRPLEPPDDLDMDDDDEDEED